MALVDVDKELWVVTRELVSDLGFELVDIELAGNRNRQVVRVYIEKAGGIFLSDCVEVSRKLGEILEEKNIIENAYHLEISSPGIERPLRKIQDFERYVGRRARIRLKGKQKGNRRIIGEIIEVDGNMVHVLSKNGDKASFSLADIAKANLDVDWNAEFQGQGKTD